MPDQVQLRGGTEEENDSFTGAQREVTVDTTNNTLRVHDGSTTGGHPLAQGSTSTDPDADTIIKRDEWGRAQVADPVDDADIANKGWVAGQIADSVAWVPIGFGEEDAVSSFVVDFTGGGKFPAGTFSMLKLNMTGAVAASTLILAQINSDSTASMHRSGWISNRVSDGAVVASGWADSTAWRIGRAGGSGGDSIELKIYRTNNEASTNGFISTSSQVAASSPSTLRTESQGRLLSGRLVDSVLLQTESGGNFVGMRWWAEGYTAGGS